MTNLVNIGFGNIVNFNKVVAVIHPDSAPSKRMIQHAREAERIIDATQGRKTKALIITENGQVIQSALQPETLAGRARGDSNRREVGLDE